MASRREKIPQRVRRSDGTSIGRPSRRTSICPPCSDDSDLFDNILQKSVRRNPAVRREVSAGILLTSITKPSVAFKSHYGVFFSGKASPPKLYSTASQCPGWWSHECESGVAFTFRLCSRQVRKQIVSISPAHVICPNCEI